MQWIKWIWKIIGTKWWTVLFLTLVSYNSFANIIDAKQGAGLRNGLSIFLFVIGVLSGCSAGAMAINGDSNLIEKMIKHLFGTIKNYLNHQKERIVNYYSKWWASKPK